MAQPIHCDAQGESHLADVLVSNLHDGSTTGWCAAHLVEWCAAVASQAAEAEAAQVAAEAEARLAALDGADVAQDERELGAFDQAQEEDGLGADPPTSGASSDVDGAPGDSPGGPVGGPVSPELDQEAPSGRPPRSGRPGGSRKGQGASGTPA